MTKALMMATAAVLVVGGAQAAYAQIYGACAAEAAATQQECLATGNPPAECAAYYQDDVAECYAYGNGPIGGPVISSRRVSAPRRVSVPHPAPRPAPHPAPRPGPEQPHR